MRTAKQYFSKRDLLIMLLISLYGCYDAGITIKVPGDYFPLSVNMEVRFKEETLSSDGSTVLSSDTLTLKVQGDTLIEGLIYQKIVNQYGLIDKVVRKDGAKYYGRNHEFYGGFSKEYLFLDISLPLHASWEHIKDEGQTKTEYVVVAINSSQIVNGVEYKDVIALDVNYYFKNADGVTWQLSRTAKHYYAPGAGEIYAHYPYPSFSRQVSILP